MPKKKTSFEEDIIRLEDTIAAIESPDIGLDNALKMYKEGLAIAEKLGDMLTEAEAQVKILEDGVLVDFEA